MHDDSNASSISPDLARFMESIKEAMRVPPPSSRERIHRVPEMLRKTSDYVNYYVPKVVSIGPYHYGNEKLESVEKLKPYFMDKLLLKYNVRLESMCTKLGEANMVQELRRLYEEKSTDHLSDMEFTRMMLLDGCFILYYIQFIYGEKAGYCRELRSHQVVLVQQDLFLLENQIPFKVIKEMMELIKLDRRDKFESFLADSMLEPGRLQKRGWFVFPTSFSTQIDEYDHLLHRLYCDVTSTDTFTIERTFIPRAYGRSKINTHKKDTVETSNRRTFHNVYDLLNKGIHFKPSSSTQLDSVEFVKHCWWFSADLKLPPITVERLLNLLAYELCSGDGHNEWVMAYICLLDSLIDEREDVKALRNAGVLDTPVGNDKEVADMFNEIGMVLVPNNLAYSKVKKQIQMHYDKWNSAHLGDLKHDYLKSPWSLLAILGGVMVLILSVVQTYFTVWSPKSECDHLCKFLKMNHHL